MKSTRPAAASFRIERLSAAQAREHLAELCEVLADCVEGGASVGFMWPFTVAKAQAFWQRIAASVERGERVLLVARSAQGRIDGTVQVVIDQMENQPHRGDVSKLLVHRRAREQGVGAALMQAAERSAREVGKTLLVLDTATPVAERLYQRLGWQLSGRIPDYALLPDGALCATAYYYKAIA